MSAKEDQLRQAASAVRQEVRSKLHTIWWAFLLRGVLALGLAACALFWPQQTLQLLIKLLGAYFLIDGVAGVVGAYRAPGKGSLPVQAVASLVAGLVLLLWADVSAKLFLVFVGVWALLQGVGIFLSSRSMDVGDENRSAVAIAGAIIAAVGIVFVVWPETGIVAISWLIAAGAFVVGGLLVVLATRLRRAKKRLDAIDT